MHTCFIFIARLVFISRNLHVNLFTCPQIDWEVDEFRIFLHQILEAGKNRGSIYQQAIQLLTKIEILSVLDY
jgi:hypothetical protein